MMVNHSKSKPFVNRGEDQKGGQWNRPAGRVGEPLARRKATQPDPLVAADRHVVALLGLLLTRVSGAFKARPFRRAANHISVDVVVVD